MALEVDNRPAANEVIVLPGFSRVYVDGRDSRIKVASFETESRVTEAGDIDVEANSPLKRTYELSGGPWIFASEDESVAGPEVS